MPRDLGALASQTRPGKSLDLGRHVPPDERAAQITEKGIAAGVRELVLRVEELLDVGLRNNRARRKRKLADVAKKLAATR